MHALTYLTRNRLSFMLQFAAAVIYAAVNELLLQVCCCSARTWHLVPSREGSLPFDLIESQHSAAQIAVARSGV